MTEVMQGILAEAKKNKFSQIKDILSEDDVAAVWENVSQFIEKQMSQQKGVIVNGLGTFTFTQKKLDIGNNKFILMQRPIFTLSEKFAQTHNLQHPKYHVPGQIPVVPLNFAAMAFESPFDRDTTESCVKEILGAVSRAVASRKNVELTFTGIGRLSIRENKVKMRFYKEFINQMDGTGKLMATMQNRPGTVDSVMSDRPMSRSGSSATVILPKISNTSLVPGGGGLAPVAEEAEANMMTSEPPGGSIDEPMPPPAVHPIDANPLEPSHEEPQVTSPLNMAVYGDKDGMEEYPGKEFEDVDTAAAIRNIEFTGEGIDEYPPGYSMVNVPNNAELDAKDDQKKAPSRSGSRMAMAMAKATGVSILDDLIPSAHTPKSAPSPLQKSSPTPLGDGTVFKPKPPSPKLTPLQRSTSAEGRRLQEKAPHAPPMSACGHPNAGQELCYLCHQRARRNVPVSFTEERKRREDEEDHLLQQFQYMKDAEDTLAETENNLAKRHDLQKMAAFNLGVAEAVLTKKKSRDTEFHKSYIFQRRPLTPPRIIKQDEYSKDLEQQVTSKDQVKKKRQSDEDFLERLEQVQLAEDLAAQRAAFLHDKNDQQEMYKRALETQLRFKPLQVPPREPDNEVFGKNDMNNEKMADRRRKAFELFQQQQDLVAQRKREAILRRLNDQREEEDVLERTKKELCEDRGTRFKRRFETRKRLEGDWANAATSKRENEMSDRLHALSPSLLLHEQCDKYHRCAQCKRKLANCGESNIWCDSRYIPGSRLMV